MACCYKIPLCLRTAWSKWCYIKWAIFTFTFLTLPDPAHPYLLPLALPLLLLLPAITISLYTGSILWHGSVPNVCHVFHHRRHHCVTNTAHVKTKLQYFVRPAVQFLKEQIHNRSKSLRQILDRLNALNISVTNWSNGFFFLQINLLQCYSQSQMSYFNHPMNDRLQEIHNKSKR